MLPMSRLNVRLRLNTVLAKGAPAASHRAGSVPAGRVQLMSYASIGSAMLPRQAVERQG